MVSEPLFGKHLQHGSKWNRALSVDDSICPGKDPEDLNCKCPDLMYSTRVHLMTGTTVSSLFYCGCCDLPIKPLGPRPTAGPGEEA